MPIPHSEKNQPHCSQKVN